MREASVRNKAPQALSSSVLQRYPTVNKTVHTSTGTKNRKSDSAKQSLTTVQQMGVQTRFVGYYFAQREAFKLQNISVLCPQRVVWFMWPSSGSHASQIVGLFTIRNPQPGLLQKRTLPPSKYQFISGADKSFSVNILCFGSHNVSDIITQLCHCRRRAAIDTT